MFKLFKRIVAYLRTQRSNYLTGNKFMIKTSNGVFLINTTYGHPLKTYLESMNLYDRFLHTFRIITKRRRNIKSIRSSH